MPPHGKRRKGKQGGTPTIPEAKDDTAEASKESQDLPPRGDSDDLILTSEKRRGVYECDYCHSDISQLPRIRCAVCPDFDLCLDCFATTDHGAAIARLKAAADVQSALTGDETSAIAGGVSMAAINHDDSHGYRVCDSTRYPIFPISRNIVRSSSSNVDKAPDANDDRDETTTDGKTETNESDAAAVETEPTEQISKAEDMEIVTEEASEKLEKKATNVSDAPSEKGQASLAADTSDAVSDVVVQEDPKNIWTVEEDLRLLEGIKTHGLGNWVEISENVLGQGSIGKTPKRCMERYFDDYLGRYGNILPPYTFLVEDNEKKEEEVEDDAEKPVADTTKVAEVEGTPRASKRRAVMLRSPSSVSNMSLASRKKYKVVPTETVPGCEEIWPHPYIPPIEGVQIGQEVGRDQACRSEQSFVKTIGALENKDEVEKVRKEWESTKLNKPGGPKVLPPRPDDVIKWPGSELVGYMPRRGDFDIEWENNAEEAVADMEFLPGESRQDRELKLQVLGIYNSKLDDREKRKQFVLSRNLHNYRKNHEEELKLPRDELDLVNRMRLFERFHTPEEHKKFIDDLLKAKRLRKEIAKLQMYRRMGIRTLAEAEKYELDKSRRQFHKMAHSQKAAELNKEPAGGTATPVPAPKPAASHNDETISSSLWPQYRTSVRKVRKSVNRGQNTDTSMEEEKLDVSEKKGDSEAKEPSTEKQDSTESGPAPMEADTPKAGDEQKVTSDATPEKDKEVAAEKPEEFDELARLPGFSLLSRKEVALCHKISLVPQQYLEIKRALIHESLMKGLLDKEGPGSSKRTLVKMDVERRGDVIDFMVHAGWISPKLGNVARTLPQEPTVLAETTN